MASPGLPGRASVDRTQSDGDMEPESQPSMDQVQSILTERTSATWDDPSLICAAVLIPLLSKNGEWHVLVTQRTETVEHHKGQISFPGGACDPDDASTLATALRETCEEIGIPAEQVKVLGSLDDIPTITGFVVTPFVGVIPHPFPYRLNEVEVAAVVEVPLSFLRDPDNLHVEQREFQDRVLDMVYWTYGSYTIWGATAYMLKCLLDLLP